MTVSETIGFDLYDRGWRVDCAGEWRRLRDEAPVFRSPSGYAAVSRYDDVLFVYKHPEIFSSKAQQGDAFGLEAIDPDTDAAQLERLFALVAGLPLDLGELMESRMIPSADPPRHTYLRRIGNRGFSQRRLAQWESWVYSIVSDLLGSVDREEGFDVVADLAAPLPAVVVCRILGLDRERARDLQRWADTVAQAGFGLERGTLTAQTNMIEALSEFSSFMVPIIEARKEAPGEDLVSDLVRAELAEDPLTPTETVMFILVVMLGGIETTKGAVGNAIVELLRHPDQLQMILEDRSLLGPAIDEVLRFRTPTQVQFREVLAPVELSGVALEPGEKVAILLGAANRDDRRFARPDEFDITRDASGHLAFGHGIHYCLGAHLGKLEGRAALEALLDDLPRLRLAEEPEIVDEFAFWGYKRVSLIPV